MNEPVADLCVGAVLHERLRPVGHCFVYRVFFLRLRLSGLATLGNRWFSVNRFNLWSFYVRDHGARDGGDLLTWARAQLSAAGVSTADGEIVLQTFPRVLGYVFNPISVWYCFDRVGALRAAICEVNNTFGEHHNYVVANADEAPIEPGAWLIARKVFHVSPFCNVRGHYRFQFDCADRHVRTQIDYYESPADADKTLSTVIAGKVRALNSRSTLNTFVSAPWFTFAIITRIHWHALQLWLKRVPWFRKPPPPATEKPRLDGSTR